MKHILAKFKSKTEKIKNLEKSIAIYQDHIDIKNKELLEYEKQFIQLGNELKVLSSQYDQLKTESAKQYEQLELESSQRYDDLKSKNAQLEQTIVKAENEKLQLLKENYHSYKLFYLNHWMEVIHKSANQGCGLYYEVYEDRRQNAIANFITKNSLNEQEIQYLKDEYEYTEDHEVYSEIDEETGEEMSIYEIIAKESI